MSVYSLEPKPSGWKVKVKLYLSKADFKNAPGVDTSKFPKKGWFSKLNI